ncbi:gastrula zinc finger protein XlCGF52.1-like isoform X2 [Frankliniella occidentalis]|uniref:Gastrula zinc finger protein XlCGF52.1-like isoform X2 n=1 Tax=Frankliniella occidentalis TaxID=133901 RepID=A0A6J1T7U3_FRAOC|nr:gastrula zinc finger protein XlCGF52.1-like isoform X2 [Frankliniella occidentalis]
MILLTERIVLEFLLNSGTTDLFILFVYHRKVDVVWCDSNIILKPLIILEGLKFMDFSLFYQQERRQALTLPHNVAPASDIFSNTESFGVSTECASIPSTSTGKMNYDPELLKVEIKEEDVDETLIGSISSESDFEDIPSTSSKNNPKLKHTISSKRKVQTLLESAKFRCTSCGKSFCNKYSLSRHKQSHSKKTFTCSFCDKIFTNQESWLRHERMHQIGNRYKCQMCEKSYVSSTSYAAHLRKHTGERPYKCVIQDCEETFYLLSSFERHIAKHKGMKEFKCEICSSAFWVPDDLRAHVNRMH